MLRIKRIGEDGDLRLGLFDTKSKTALSSLQSSVDSLKKELIIQIDNVLSKNKTEVLNEFNQSAKSILAAYNEELSKKMSDNQKTLESGYSQYVNKLKSILEKDLMMGDEGEDELDEEVLGKDIDDEENEKENR